MTLTAPPPRSTAVRTADAAGPTRLRRIRQERVGLATLLLGTAMLYLAGLSASGWGNAYYAAAAQAGSESWSAFFFGASDAPGSITIDKPPLAVWPMALSVRVFGLSSWSVLGPQALLGVATVALVHATVRRVTGSGRAGLLAGTVVATTPVAVLMFRFDNPDALLTLLLTGAAYAVVRALQTERAVRWLVLGGVLVGLAFLTKSLQALLVLPGLALGYGLVATGPWRRRLGHLLAAFGAMVAAGGWWVAVVELVPPSSRPHVGGTRTDSFVELTLGHNGFDRITGVEGGPEHGPGWGDPGLLRLIGPADGGHTAWLLPAALTLGVAALVWGSRLVRALAVVLLGWLLVTALTFSLMAGVYHPYYSVVLAPAIGGLVAVGAVTTWRRREAPAAAALLGGTALVTAALAFLLLSRTPDWHPWLRVVVLVLGLAITPLLVGVRRLSPRATSALASAAVVVALAGPAGYAVHTAATPHSGSVPTAGPPAGPGGVPGNAVRWAGGTGRPGGDGGVGGLRAGSPATARVTAALLDDADSFTWVAATVGAQSAAGFQLATGRPVMPVGGFTGRDPSPTLTRFQRHVALGWIHWFVDGGGGAPSRISAWVRRHFTATRIDGVTLYDLSGS